MFTFPQKDRKTIWVILGYKAQEGSAAELGESREHGDRSTPLSPIGQMDLQLEEVGRYRQRDFKKARTDRERGSVTCRFPKIEGSKGLLVGQRAKHWAELCQDLRAPGSGRPGLDAGLRSVSVKIALSFHHALPLQNSFIIKLYINTFDEDSLETATLTQPHKNLYTQCQGMNMQNVGRGLIGGSRGCIETHCLRWMSSQGSRPH